MSYILNIETSTTVCSVSLSKKQTLISYRELDAGFTHAENLHLFIREIIKESGLTPRDLNAIAVSKGPGSYTGLRIGVSAAKGLAYSLDIPLISIDTLQIMCNHKLVPKEKNAFYCPMIDARRMEVYCALYNHRLEQELPVEAMIVDENSVQKLKAYPEIFFFGDGMTKCKNILTALPHSKFIENIIPSATAMCDLSYEKYTSNSFEDTAYFEPFYLKDFLISSKKR